MEESPCLFFESVEISCGQALTACREHVMRDLEPYVCIFHDCPDGDVLYRDKSKWLSHMQWKHTLRWCCSSPSHKLLTFESEEDYELHMHSNHGNAITDAQLQILKDTDKRPAPITFTECPFCGFSPISDLPQNLSPGHLPQSLSPNELMKKDVFDSLVLHVSTHLQATALISLPWPDDVDDEASSGVTASRPGKGSTMDDVNSVKDFSFDTSVPDGSFSFDDSTPHDSAASTHEWEADPIFDGVTTGEWSFIPETEYTGHDEDPVLHSFRLKLYLGASSGTEKADGPLLPFQFIPPSKVRRFFGREEILEVMQHTLCADLGQDPKFYDSKTSASCFVLCGPGGES
jgi:hypothetical protein